MGGLFWIVLIFPSLALLWITRGRLTPFYLSWLGLSQMLGGGAVALGSRPGNFAELLVWWLGPLGALAGYAYGARRGRIRSKVLGDARGCSQDGAYSAALILTWIVVASLAAYHFVAAGVPLLMADVELARFNFTGSGLFGLPGRTVLFGVAVLFFLASRTHGEVDERRTYGARIALGLSFMTFAASRMLMGFKSGMLEVFALILFVEGTRANPPNVLKAFRRYSLPLAVAVVYATSVAGLYRTVTSSGLSTGEYFIRRMTLEAAQPGLYVLQRREVLSPYPGESLYDDIRYYFPKYAGFTPVGEAAFTKVVASEILAVPSRYASDSVPVTIGAFARLVYDFGVLAGITGMFLLGWLFRSLELRVPRTGSPRSAAVVLAALWGVHDYLTKGDVIFSFLNWGMMLTFVTGLHLALEHGIRHTLASPNRASSSEA